MLGVSSLLGRTACRIAFDDEKFVLEIFFARAGSELIGDFIFGSLAFEKFSLLLSFRLGLISCSHFVHGLFDDRFCLSLVLDKIVGEFVLDNRIRGVKSLFCA